MRIAMFHDVCWNDKEIDLKILILLKDAIVALIFPSYFKNIEKFLFSGFTICLDFSPYMMNANKRKTTDSSQEPVRQLKCLLSLLHCGISTMR